MYNPVDGALLYEVFNIECWTKQGTSFLVGGSYTTTPGIPSQQLQASTNTTLGYNNGQMLATSNGDGTGQYAGQIAGAMINWDPNSTDTGQAIWNRYVICDPAIKYPLPILTTYPGNIQCATDKQNWVLRQQFLYGPGTPATDTSIVQTAVAAYGTQSQLMNSSGSNETIFAY